MATKPTAAIALLQGVNGNAYDEQDNPLGLAQGGHRQVFVPVVEAVADVGNWAAQIAVEIDADAAEIDADAQAVEAGRQDAATSRDAAAGSAGAAAASATASANSAANLVATSTTSLAISAGSKVFATQVGKQFGVGSRVTITNDAAPASRIMYGTVTAYAGTSLTVNVDNVLGSGTYAAWTIRLSGDRGAGGATGPSPFNTPVEWASGVAYVVGPPASAVTYLGETYVCILGHISSGSILPTNATYWRKIAAKGNPGDTPTPSFSYALNLHFGA